jgi:CheY-like chemotaxis protein
VILYAAADLIWATKIKATAEALGLAARPVRTLEMLHARLADCPEAKSLMVDLDKGEEGLALIAALRAYEAANQAAGQATDQATGQGRRLRVLAWGPHVAKELLQAARDAGADDVLTRGALEHNMEEVLVKLAGRA